MVCFAGVLVDVLVEGFHGGDCLKDKKVSVISVLNYSI